MKRLLSRVLAPFRLLVPPGTDHVAVKQKPDQTVASATLYTELKVREFELVSHAIVR